MDKSNPNEAQAALRDPFPQRLHTIVEIFPWEEGKFWQALYIENEAASYRPIAIWCNVKNDKGKFVGGDEKFHDMFGLVIVGNRLEIPDTHDTFIAYVRNIDKRLERDLIYDWRMAHNR